MPLQSEAVMEKRNAVSTDVRALLTDTEVREQYLRGLAGYAEFGLLAQGITQILNEAAELTPRKRDALLSAGTRAVVGLVELAELEGTGRPVFIDRIDMNQRGAKATRRRYHEVFAALGFVYDRTERFKETDRRLQKRHIITENHLYAPDLSGTSQRLAIVEFWVDDYDLSIFAELQQTPDA